MIDEEIIRSKEPTSSSDTSALLPEIAKLLDVSVSSLESRPPDVIEGMCLTYINTYPIGEEVAIRALTSFNNMNTQQEYQGVIEVEKLPETSIHEDNDSIRRQQLDEERSQEEQKRQQLDGKRQRPRILKQTITAEAMIKSARVISSDKNTAVEKTEQTKIRETREAR